MASQDADAGGRIELPVHASVCSRLGGGWCSTCRAVITTSADLPFALSIILSRLGAAETARREAEQERDRLRYDLPGLLNEQDRVEQELRTTLAQAEAKAALADRYRRINSLFETKDIDDDYDALTPTHESEDAVVVNAVVSPASPAESASDEPPAP